MNTNSRIRINSSKALALTKVLLKEKERKDHPKHYKQEQFMMVSG